MSPSIGSWLTGGVRRIAHRNGVRLILASMALGLAGQMSFRSASATLLQ